MEIKTAATKVAPTKGKIQMSKFNGLGVHLGNLSRLSDAQTRSISAENFTGAKGKAAMATEGNGASAARDLGRGWKVSPSVMIGTGQTFTLADIQGPGAIQSMWLGCSAYKELIFRIYWDDQEQPSVEAPLHDFFALPWGVMYKQDGRDASVRVNSLPVVVAPKSGLNCFWEMPFRKRCRITLQNIHPEKALICYNQINYVLTEIPDDCAYFHAQYRRVNPLPYKVPYTIVDGIVGRGQYVGTSMGWGINHNGWWGEGEIKFYLDGDQEFPTICGTGTEDYFGGSYDWDVDNQYQTYSTPYLGMHQVIKPDGLYNSQHRHAMYRWHIQDPIRFQHDLKVTIQALGWRSERRYYPGQHDISSVAYWYQTLPTAPFPQLPDRDGLEIV
jgi:hypothetical protein